MKKIQLFIVTVFAMLSMFSCGGEDKTAPTTSEKQDSIKEPEIVEAVFVATTFGELLVELESNMGWESVTEDWKVRRESWVADCDAASDVTVMSDLLLEFEANVQWSAVNPSWAKVRDAWGVDCIAASSEGELADLLVIFESYVLWDVVSPNWVDLRADWIVRCEAL